MDNANTPLWDSTISIEERLDWLIEALSIDEKLKMLSTVCPQIERLGIRRTYLGEEASHGVEAKHDRSVNWGEPRCTTTFPQPIGMSQTWDKELIKKVGNVVGTEARILYEEEGCHGGLCRWTPTVEPEYNPGWGRTEESYGEDPLLTGMMASAYIKGMKGTDRDYIKTASTLKYFYCYNEESHIQDISVDLRNQFEYFFEPYRICIKEGGAEALMTSSSIVNGVPCMLNTQLQYVVKDTWKLPGHIVGNEGELENICKNPEYSDAARTLALALKAGTDCFADDPDFVERAAREAYERKLIDAEDINRAVRNTFRTRLRLGMFNCRDEDPFDKNDRSLLAGETHAQVSLQAGREAVVLLKNEGKMLPIKADEPQKIAVIGPLANEWFKDWYGGIPPYSITPYQGIKNRFEQSSISYTDGKNRIYLKCGEKYISVLPDGRLTLDERSKAEEFVLTDWDQGIFNIQASSTGCFLTSIDENNIVEANRKEAFGKYVKECFYMIKDSDGAVRIENWCHRGIIWNAEGIMALQTGEEQKAVFYAEEVWDGPKRAAVLAQEADTVIAVLGTNPVINAKIGCDRQFYGLPQFQKQLLEKISSVNKNIILVIISNYSHDLNWCMDKDSVRAVLFSPSGCQELGNALADIISGAWSPSGRLNMTWYDELINDGDGRECNVITQERTYMYCTKKVQFPFGYGLSYTSFEYENFSVQRQGDSIRVQLSVQNTGIYDGAEVVQVYAAAEDSPVKYPLKRLAGFEYVYLRAGEKRELSMDIPFHRLMVYNVVTESFSLFEGNYRFWLGRNADTQVCLNTGDQSGVDIMAQEELFISGDIRIRRDFANITGACQYDDSSNIQFINKEGMLAIKVKNPEEEAVLVYECGDGASLSGSLCLKAWTENESSIEIAVNGELSQSCVFTTQGEVREVCIKLPEYVKEIEASDSMVTLEIHMHGNMGIGYFWFV